MGILGTAVKVAVASSVHGRVQRRQQQRWAQQDLEAGRTGWVSDPSAPPGAAIPAGPTAPAVRIEQLTQLGALRDAGVLTEAEFEAQKALILAS